MEGVEAGQRVCVHAFVCGVYGVLDGGGWGGGGDGVDMVDGGNKGGMGSKQEREGVVVESGQIVE
jgi:hypothetical protein